MDNSICIIGAYFGKFNNYFPLWLMSCANNPQIDFLVFNDCSWTGNVPPNVKLIPITLPEMKELAIKKTGILDLYLDQPYKCCDFKPLYGEIFQDYISEYEYWGHCDFDLIFGDLYSFLNQYEYQNYDKFLNLGHLTFYRNNEEVNHRYIQSGAVHPYLESLTNSKNYGFDENSGMCKIYLQNKYSFFYKRLYADISPIYHRFKLSEYCSLDVPDTNYRHQVFYYKDKKTYRAYLDNNGQIRTEEFMYIHFQKRPNFIVNFNVALVDSFYITNEGFTPMDGNVTIEDLLRYNKYWPLIEPIEKMIWILKYYKKAIKEKWHDLFNK